MRVRYALAFPLLVVTAGCVRQPPQSAATTPATAPASAAAPLPGVLFLINGRALAAGHTLAELDRRYITSVDHLIGPAAQPYLRPNFREVYLIATTDSAAANRMTIP